MRITELFDNGQFVVTAEVGPPKGIHVDHMVEEAKEYLSDITAVNVTDNQSSVMRMGSLPACVALKNAGLTPILQLTCRDRNRIALQSELLGAAMLGIENILCCGDFLITQLAVGNCHGGIFDLKLIGGNGLEISQGIQNDSGISSADADCFVITGLVDLLVEIKVVDISGSVIQHHNRQTGFEFVLHSLSKPSVPVG